MKRLFTRLRSNETAKSFVREALIEALRASGCALCTLSQQHNPRYVETLLDEAVMDVDQRDSWRAARGLCNWHAWMALEVVPSASNLAILYDDVLYHDLSLLASAFDPATVPRRWSRRRHLGARVHAWLQSWKRVQGCQACVLWLQQEDLYNTTLLDEWPEIEQAFQVASGFCWPHFQGLVTRYRTHPHLAALVAAQWACLTRLQQELREFIRKQDYRFAHEPYGREADAWQRAVALYAGIRGRFGEQLCAALKQSGDET